MLASRVGVLGAVVAVLVLTLELGVAVQWKRQVAPLDLQSARAQVQEREISRLKQELDDLDRQLDTLKRNHDYIDLDNVNDQLIVPNRAGF
jgi:cell division protein FtsB